MDFGSHCSFRPCRRLDFLPLFCEYCKDLYCDEHKKPENHACKKFGGEGELTGGTSGMAASHPLFTSETSALVQCSAEGCGRREREIVMVTCSRCSWLFCLSHRHPTDHSCHGEVRKHACEPVRAAPIAVESNKCQIQSPGSRIPHKPRGAKSAALSAKVAFMKLKQKAEGLGPVPENERLFYLVSLPKEYRHGDKPVYISREWTVGKTVDALAAKFKLRNDNDKPEAKKLRLLAGEGLILNNRHHLRELEQEVPTGSTLWLEYT